MHDTSPDTKQQAILESAASAFASYGYRKTSMDDIARASGVSRPALYVHFRNKQDILRSLVQLYYDEAAEGVALALQADGSVAKRLGNAFLAQAGRMSEVMLGSPHGMELLESSTGVAMDIVEAGEARLSDIYADWLVDEMAAGRIDLQKSPEHVATTLMAALKGLKKQGMDPESYQARMETLAIMVATGLATR
ncbi:MAG: TetR family transcriptional regulator [Rhodobacteraceae bacterium]|nr:TetR family transcriptional regulator [Paracoccaceae bacterium]